MEYLTDESGELLSAFVGNATESTFSNKLDHFGSNTTMYDQRYWLDDQFYQDGGPNFLYVCGEWVCSAANINTVPMKFAQERNAKIWSLEHRFYGKS